MARTDLHGFCYGDGGLAERIESYRAGELTRWEEPPIEEVHILKVWFKLDGEQSKAAVEKLPVKPGFAGIMVAEKLEAIITEAYGGDATGQLSVTFYADGQSGIPAIRITRNIAGEEVSSDPNIDLLKKRNAVLEQRERETFTLLTTHLATQATLIASQTNSIQALATTRAVSSATADVGGPGGLLGALVAVAAFPIIKRQLGLPRDANLEDVAEAVADYGKVAIARLKKETQNGGTPKIPGPGAVLGALVGADAAADEPSEDELDPDIQDALLVDGEEVTLDDDLVDVAPANSAPTDVEILKALQLLERGKGGDTELMTRAMRVAIDNDIDVAALM